MQQIIHPSLDNLYLVRHINGGWWQDIETEKKYTAEVGDTYLIRRSVNCQQKSTNCLMDCTSCTGTKIVTEYGVTRTEDGWERQIVVFPMGELSPYPFQIDCFSNRLHHLLDHLTFKK